jgi:hypothetical protein
MYAYADGIVIVTKFREKVIEIYKGMAEKEGKIGLEENGRKTIYI